LILSVMVAAVSGERFFWPIESINRIGDRSSNALEKILCVNVMSGVDAVDEVEASHSAYKVESL
jgi:hypothetical protein